MLEAEVGDVVAERVEEVVVAVVVRAEKFLRLIDQALVVVPGFGWRFEGGGAVGGDVHFGDGIAGQRDDFQKFSGDDRGIDQRGEGDGGEVNFVSALAGDGKRRAELPSVGKFQAGGVVDVVGFVALGIEQDLIPADDGQLVGGGGAGGESAFEGGGGEEVELGVNFCYAGGDFDVEGESVEQVAAPFQGLAGGGELQSGEIDDGAVGSVFAGNPLGVVEDEVAGRGGDFQRGVEDFAGGGGGVDGDGDGGRGLAPQG